MNFRAKRVLMKINVQLMEISVLKKRAEREKLMLIFRELLGTRGAQERFKKEAYNQ